MELSLPMLRSRAAEGARFAGALAVPVLALEAIGVRMGTLPGEAIVPLLAAGFGLALLALALGIYALADIWRSGSYGLGAAVAGIVYALPALALLIASSVAAIVYPAVSDVSTDLDEPPDFVEAPAGGEPRPVGPNPDLQLQAYPDLNPQFYPMPVEEVYSVARGLIDGRGWTISAEEPPPSMPMTPAQAEPAPQPDEFRSSKTTVLTQSRGEAVPPAGEAEDAPGAVAEAGHLQAVAPTPIFGFPDDVVLRFVEAPEGTRLDMRSASRIGVHDLGQNARRIRSFFAELDAAFQALPQAVPSGPALPASDLAADSPTNGAGASSPVPPDEELPASE